MPAGAETRGKGGETMTWKDLVEILAEQFSCEPDELTKETGLYDDLGADELDITELAWNIGEGIGHDVPDADIAACETVGDVWRYLCEHTWRAEG